MNSEYSAALPASPFKISNDIDNATPAPDFMRFARYTAAYDDGAYRFRFIRAYCGKSYSTGIIHAESAGVAVQIAEREVARNYNGCHKCGRWVCDRHYNMNAMTCVKCVPRKPRRRGHCGGAG